MSTNTTRYVDKKKRQDRLYAPMPVPPRDIDYPDGRAIIRRYGDASPIIYHDELGHPVQRSQT